MFNLVILIVGINFIILDFVVVLIFHSSDEPSSVSGHSSTRGGESGNESDDEDLDDDDDDDDDDMQSSPVKEGEDNEDEDFQKLIQTLQDVIDDNSRSTTCCLHRLGRFSRETLYPSWRWFCFPKLHRS